MARCSSATVISPRSQRSPTSHSAGAMIAVVDLRRAELRLHRLADGDLGRDLVAHQQRRRVRAAELGDHLAALFAHRCPGTDHIRPGAMSTGLSSFGGLFVRVLVGRELERAVEHLLEVTLLDWQRPVGQLSQLGVAGLLVHLRHDRPVADLAGLGHGEELESVERVVLAAEVRLAHLGRLLLDLARLLDDRGLLALERAGQRGAALLRLARLLGGLLELLGERRVLGVQHAAHLARGILGGHREAEHLGQLALEVGQRRHQLTASLTLPMTPLVSLATTPVGSSGSPAASRSLRAISAISSGA